MSIARKESGAVLVLGLVMLLVLSVIVVAASKSTMLQQKMTNNFRDNDIAFQSAETALKTGERTLKNLTKTQLKNIIYDGNSGYYTFDNTRPLSEESDWDNLNTLDSEQSLHQVKEAPVFIIENIVGVQPPGGSLQVPKVNDSSYFRITAKGKGGTDNSLTILQSIFKK